MSSGVSHIVCQSCLNILMHITFVVLTLKMATVMCTKTLDQLQNFTRLNREIQNCTREQLCCMWMWLYFFLLRSDKYFKSFFDFINSCCFLLSNTLRARAVWWLIKYLVDLKINIWNKSNRNAAQSGKTSLEYMNYISDMSITDTVYSLKFLLLLLLLQ